MSAKQTRTGDGAWTPCWAPARRLRTVDPEKPPRGLPPEGAA